jgi:hypothetical protein
LFLDFIDAQCPYGTGVVSGDVVVQALGFSDRVVSHSMMILSAFVIVALLSGYKVVERMARQCV